MVIMILPMSLFVFSPSCRTWIIPPLLLITLYMSSSYHCNTTSIAGRQMTKDFIDDCIGIISRIMSNTSCFIIIRASESLISIHGRLPLIRVFQHIPSVIALYLSPSQFIIQSVTVHPLVSPLLESR